MGKKIDLTDKKFGKLIVLCESKKRDSGHVFWWCHCECGSLKVISGSSLKIGRTKSCGCFQIDTRKKRIGKKNPHWKGGRIQTPDGYFKLLKPNHPRADDIGYVFEHILKAEKDLGYYISLPKVVHHIDGNRQNNNPDNLMILPNASEHSKLHWNQRKC